MTTAVVPRRNQDTIYLTTEEKGNVGWGLVEVEEEVDVEEVEEEDHHGTVTVIQELDNEEPEEQETTMGERGMKLMRYYPKFSMLNHGHWPSKQDNIKLRITIAQRSGTISCEKWHHKGFVWQYSQTGWKLLFKKGEKSETLMG